MTRSLSVRVRKIFFWSYCISVIFILVMAWLALEYLEDATLQMDKQTELDHFVNRHEIDKIINIKSAALTLSYLPAAVPPDTQLPIIFRGIKVPYEGEVDFLGKEYLVITKPLYGGTYYMAKDLSLFNERERLMIIMLLTMGGGVVLLGYFLSVIASRMFSRPVEKLSQDILNIGGGESAQLLSTTYKEAELNTISSAFNQYIDMMAGMVERERSLITMASHELRTPIAVVAGAAEVMIKRNRMTDEDKKTLGRIISATETMSANVQALLTVVRQSTNESYACEFDLVALVEVVIVEIRELRPDDGWRIDVSIAKDPVMIFASVELTRMLLQNLVINALNHNQGRVMVSVENAELKVFDEAKPVDNDKQDPEYSTGLGLYIVNSICAQQGWQFSLVQSPYQQTIASVKFHG